jgi:uncharacterized membrane protein YgcG
MSIDFTAAAPVLFFIFFIIRAFGSMAFRGALSGSAKGSVLVTGALYSPAVGLGVIVLLICGFVILQTPLQAAVTAISTVLCIALAVLTRKKTEYYTHMLGRIRGFANFIKTAELDRIKMLVDENPAYFFDILPYAWAMGLTSEWAEKFDRLGLGARPPQWYSGYDPGMAFTYMFMANSISRSSRGIEAAMARSQAASRASSRGSGGGFSGGGGFSSGGGFSGGGFGGGGGGRW